MKFQELPDSIRVKLTEETERRFWKTIDDFGGVQQFSQEFGYSRSKLYNWKNKDCFLPVELVRTVLGSSPEGIVAIKGRSNSRPLENPGFPLPVTAELLTRVKCSVVVNREGVPFFQSDDIGRIERFAELLEDLGEVPFQVYNRSVYELRYPKYLQKIFSSVDFDTSFAALVDEKGVVENGFVKAGDRKVPVEEFEGELYSRDKKLQLALERNDEETVAEIIVEENRRIQKALSV